MPFKKVCFFNLFLSAADRKTYIVYIVTSVTIYVIMNTYMYNNDCIYTAYETTNMRNYIYTSACIYIYNTHTRCLYKYIHTHITYIHIHISRHTVVCCAAQEAGTPHREYIYRKKVNVIFTLLQLRDSLSD